MAHELTYKAIRDANLEPLREAVREWKKIPEKMDTVATTFGRTVAGPLEQSGWHGESANAAFKKFRSVRQQMSEAAGEARKISTNLSEALSTFEFSQDEIKNVERAVHAKPEEGTKNYLKLDETKGVVSIDHGHKEDIPNLEKLQRSVDECNRRIKEAIANASKADHALKTVLQIDPPGKGFNDDIAGHLRDVRKETKEDVDTLMKLAGDDGLKTDKKKLEQFNAILAKNAHNSDFAEEFATRKGAKGILDFWNRTARPEYGEDEHGFPKAKALDAATRKQLAALQDNLGNTLALASHSDSPKMTQWKQDVIDLGYKRLPAVEDPGTHDARPPYGFQVMSNLMRTGKWDSQFLNHYGDELIAREKSKFESHGQELPGHRRWLSEGMKPVDYLNFGPKADQGADPMTGFLEAMGHNGDASTEFFTDKGHFDYLLKDREYIQDGANNPDFDPRKDVVPSRTALGHALGAAATGHAWDTPLDHNPSHTKEQAELMSKLVTGFGAAEHRLTLAPGMHDGLGNAAAEYSPDFFRAIKDGSDDGKLFPMSGEQAGMSHGEATRFLVQVGQDADANAAITLGQKHYTAQALEHHLAGDLPADQRYDASRKDTVDEILRASGESAGTLAIGRQEALIAPAIREEQDFDQSTLSKRLWANGALGVVAGGVSALKPIADSHPVAAVVTAAVLTGASSAGASDADAAYWNMNKSTPAAEKASLIYEELSKRDVQQNEKIFGALEKEHGIHLSKSWAEKFSDDGFSQAYSRVGTTAPFLSSLDKVKEQ
ncbi:DUF6571 family protein [Streptomyces sp. 8N114]|uniref:DUF6571 family protein n=1 Tax=Streptomyces sp. 8N114 TaxID=3457419 RepID=UPI003FD1F445